MGTTHAKNLNPTELREEYGPAPWWSSEHLRELIEDRGLRPGQIADIWNAHPDTIRIWVNRHGLEVAAA